MTTEQQIELANRPIKGHVISEEKARHYAKIWSGVRHLLENFGYGEPLDKTRANEYFNSVFMAINKEGYSVYGTPPTRNEMRELVALLNYLKKHLASEVEFGINENYHQPRSIMKGAGDFVWKNTAPMPR